MQSEIKKKNSVQTCEKVWMALLVDVSLVAFYEQFDTLILDGLKEKFVNTIQY